MSHFLPNSKSRSFCQTSHATRCDLFRRLCHLRWWSRGSCCGLTWWSRGRLFLAASATHRDCYEDEAQAQTRASRDEDGIVVLQDPHADVDEHESDHKDRGSGEDEHAS